MASWRVKGYVSDSEDDEDDFNAPPAPVGHQQRASGGSSATSVSANGTSITQTNDHRNDQLDSCIPTNTLVEEPLPPDGQDNYQAPRVDDLTTPTAAEKLEKALNDGLGLVRGALSLLSSPRIVSLSEDDSPLSSPPASSLLSLAGDAPTQDRPTVPSPVITSDVPQRNLRQRSAIQQHPYSLEQARYLRHCRERGIKPVNLPRFVSPVNNRNHHESQESQFQEDSQDQDSLQALMRIDGPAYEQTVAASDSYSSIDEATMLAAVDDELPDLDSLLKCGSKQPANKMRTHSTPPRAPIADTQLVFDVTSDDDDHYLSVFQRTKSTTPVPQNDSFPSPPLTNRADSIVQQEHISPLSHSNSPTALPTPVLSSGIHRRKRLVIDDESQSGPENDAAQTTSSSSDSESSRSEDDSANIRFMQKRVKGVLPASWLSIDRLQKEIDSKRKAFRPQTFQRHEAGVAQRKMAASNRPFISHPYSDLVSSDDESDASHSRGQLEHAVSNVAASDLETSLLFDDTEAVEVLDGDGIDPMLEPRPKKFRKNRPRQTDLLGYVNEQRRTKPNRSGAAHRSASYVASRPKTRRKRSKQVFSQDLVHVLDAPDLQHSPRHTRPAFLKVAARQAKRGNRGGTGASRKFFQLDDDKDNTDIFAAFRARRKSSTTHHLQRDISRPPRLQRILDSPEKSISTQQHSNKPGSKTASKTTDGQPYQIISNNKGEFDHVVQSGDTHTKAHELRLTRLRSLLPLSNRSGAGQFARYPQTARTAYIEAPQLVRKNLANLRPRVDTAQKSIAHVRSERPPDAGIDQALETHQLPLTPPLPRRPKKTAPVFRPRLNRTVLAASNPDTTELERLIGQTGPHVRGRLEKEFTEHQAAWFQGSHSGITANRSTQHHFHIFLEVLKTFLPTALHDAEDNYSARDMRSFVHRLIPNRGTIGAQGQVGNKTLEVSEFDVVVAGNVFDLHTCLLNLAPGCAPKPRVLEMKVNFSDAHNEVCLIALEAWQTIFKAHHNDASIIEGLGGWIYSILSQLVVRWKLAEYDARNDAMNSMRQIDEQIIHSVINHNRKQASTLMCKVLSVIRQSIMDAISQKEADVLFEISRYQDFLSSISCQVEIPDNVVEDALEIPLVFVNHQWQLQRPSTITLILDCVRQTITALTSTREHFSQPMLSVIARGYFTLARTSVSMRQKSWDDFTEPRSTFCPEMFVSEKYTEGFQTWFYSLLVENQPSYYSLEFRVPILSHWVRTLLQPRHDASTANLTTAIFKNETSSLRLPDLASLFKPPGSPPEVSQIQDRLSEVRHATIIHIMACLHSQEKAPEADWLVGGLDEADAIQLLKVIFTTMRNVWISLRDDTEQQDLYTTIIHTALDQYEAFPRKDFAPDSWFFNSAVFPQRRKQDLVKLLNCSPGSKSRILNEALELFDQDIRHGLRYGRLESLRVEVLDALFPQISSSPSTQTGMDQIGLHANFVEATCRGVFSKGEPEWTSARTMMLKVLVEVLENLECTSNLFTQGGLAVMVCAVVDLIPMLRELVLLETDANRQSIYQVTELAFKWALIALDVLPEAFTKHVEAVCNSATEEETEEARKLLQTIMGKD